jgi:AmmeMemoRadiSam system protein A
MEQYKELLKLAREAINAKLDGGKLSISEEIKKKYSEEQACFVTITINSELRGCIGSLEAHQELYRDVIDNAFNAAFNDPRFKPLDKSELSKIKIEISVLSEPKKLGIGEDVFNKIDNKMGLILRKDFYTSTFLPQVWEQIPDKKEFLEQLSRKAGMGREDWKRANLWYYRVESVKE